MPPKWANPKTNPKKAPSLGRLCPNARKKGINATQPKKAVKGVSDLSQKFGKENTTRIALKPESKKRESKDSFGFMVALYGNKTKRDCEWRGKLTFCCGASRWIRE